MRGRSALLPVWMNACAARSPTYTQASVTSAVETCPATMAARHAG